MSDNELLSIRFEMRAAEPWISAVDGWRRFQPGIPSRAEAIRRLVETGLRAEPMLRELLVYLQMHGDPADEDTAAVVTRLREALGDDS